MPMTELNFEVMDEEVKDYARKQTYIFKQKFNAIFEKIRPDIKPYVYQKKVKSVELTRTAQCFVTVENGKNKLIVNGKEIYSTSGIIVWIKPEREGDRIALFETSGSDEGILRVFSKDKQIYTENGFVHDIIYFYDRFYLIREKRDENISSSSGSSNGIYLEDKYLFGKNIASGMGLSGEAYGDKIIIHAGNNISTELYIGEIGNPTTWKLFKKYKSQVKILDYENEILYTLRFEGNGILTVGEKEYPLDEPVEDAVRVKEGFLVVHMRDAKSIPVLYSSDCKKIKEFPFTTYKGLIAMASDNKRANLVMGDFGTTFNIYSYSDGQIEQIEKNEVSKFNASEDWVNVNGKNVHYFFLQANRETRNTLVYGYGGFNISLLPSYNNLFAYLLNNGVNVVICNLPGGGEYGEEWHKLGMRENKINVYESFQAVIKKLKKEGKRVICYGVSNGGLLSSYTLTQIPEYIEGAVIGNPVIDLMRFHRLLAGQYWVSEYGNPDDENDAIFLKKYSSYEQLKPGKYPPSLTYSRMSDDRVHPAHALKFYDKLISYGNEAYLMIGEGGHLGSGLEDTVDETAFIASFIEYVFSKDSNM